MTRSLSDLARHAEQRARAFRRAMRRYEKRARRTGHPTVADMFKHARLYPGQPLDLRGIGQEIREETMARDLSRIDRAHNRQIAFLYERASEAVMRLGAGALLNAARRA